MSCEILIHIGTHKTATSSIQSSIYNNREVFLAKKVLYPKSLDENHSLKVSSLFKKNPHELSFHILANRNQEKCIKYNDNVKSALRGEIKKHTDINKVLISGEDISFLEINELEMLKSFFQEEYNSPTFKIILFVRNPIDFVTSFSQEIVKAGKPIIPLESDFYKDYNSKIIKKFSKVFGKENINISTFEDSIKYEGGPVKYFLDKFIEKNILEEKYFLRSNESISQISYEILNYINKICPRTINGEVNKLRINDSCYLLWALSGEKFKFSPKEQALIFQQASNDISWLKRKLGINYSFKIKPREINFINSENINELVSIFPKLTSFVKWCIFDFFLQKAQEKHDNSISSLIFTFLNQSHTYLEISDRNFYTPIKVFQRRLQIPKHYEQADIFREIALLNEKLFRINDANDYMKMAKLFRCDGPYINKKIDAFKKFLHQNDSSNETLKKNKLCSLIHKVNPFHNFRYSEYNLDLQGWGSKDPNFLTLIDDLSPKLIIEVGSWKGGSAVFMANYIKKKNLDCKILCIDTWLGAIEFLGDHEDPQRYKSLNHQNGYPTVYYQFLANVMHLSLHDIIIPFPQTSTLAARFLITEDILADMVYIDASHDETDVYADINNYWSLVKVGGVLFGDDYNDDWPGVKQAVNKFVQDNSLELSFTERHWMIRKQNPQTNRSNNTFDKARSNKNLALKYEKELFNARNKINLMQKEINELKDRLNYKQSDNE